MISLLGSAITCFAFGASTTLQQAICIRLLQGIFAGAVGVARGCVAFITDPSNEGRAYAILGFCWGLGGVAGAIIGGSCKFYTTRTYASSYSFFTLVETPAEKWPEIFGDIQLFVTYPYLLPCGLASVVTLFGALLITLIYQSRCNFYLNLGSFLSLFLGRDGGPREGAIRLLPEKFTSHPPAQEDESRPQTPVFEEEDEPQGIAQRLKKKVSRRFSGIFARRVPDGHHASPSSPLVQPAVPLSTSSPSNRLDRVRSFSRTSRTNGSAYGYSGSYRNRLASNATTINARRGSLSSSMRRRRGSNHDGTAAGEGSDLNFAQRLLLANENAVTNIADLWVAAAMNVDNEDPFESDSDIEEEDPDYFNMEAGGNSPANATPSNPTNRGTRSNSQATTTPPVGRLGHRPSRTNVLPPSASASSHQSPNSLPHRPSVSFSPLPATSGSRRPSSTMPAIFAHPGVKTPAAVLDAQQLLLSSDSHLDQDPLAPIAESRTASEAHEDVESLSEKSPSIMSQLPIIVIIQYGVMALHTTTHDQIFMSYLVSYVFICNLQASVLNLLLVLLNQED